MILFNIKMKDLIDIGLHNHMTMVLKAHLLVIDGKVYKDRSGKYGGEGADPGRIMIPAEDVGKVTTEGLRSGQIMKYDAPEGLIILITTQPIKFQEIK
jgi:hypothetical protein